MLIAEGADFAGKTTILEWVRKRLVQQRWARRFGQKISHVQKWGRLPLDFDYGASYLNAIRNGPQLCDRFVLSELAYGAVHRGGAHPRFTSHRRRLVARELNRAGSIQILFSADWKSTKRRMLERGKDELCKDSEVWRELQAAFKRALDDPAIGFSGVATHHVSSGDSEDPKRAVTWILECWRELMVSARAVTSLAPQSWGCVHPRFAFVGERVGGDGTSDRPFSGLDEHGCSAYLNRTLDVAGVRESEVYFLNAFDNANQPLQPLVLHKLNPLRVIALGKISEKALKNAGVKCEGFPHPQYLRRFEHHEVEKWGTRLKDLLSLTSSRTSSKS